MILKVCKNKIGMVGSCKHITLQSTCSIWIISERRIHLIIQV